MRPIWSRRALGMALFVVIPVMLFVWGAQVQTGVAPRGTKAVSLSPGTDNDTGVIFTNLTNRRANLIVEAVSGDPLAGGKTVEKGFVLLDGTLRVMTNLTKGQYRLLVKREYSMRRVGRMGLRASSLRAMRMNPRMRFRVSAGSMRQQAGAATTPMRAVVGPSPTFREMRAGFAGKRSRPCLGLFGYDPVKNYVWRVVEEAGDFAVGGRRLK